VCNKFCWIYYYYYYYYYYYLGLLAWFGVGVILRSGLSHNVTRVLSFFVSGLGRWLRVATLCTCFYWVSVWNDQGGQRHRFISYAYTNMWYQCNGLSFIYFLSLLLLLSFIKWLLWRFSLFLLKLSLDTPFHLGSTENTTMEQGTVNSSSPLYPTIWGPVAAFDPWHWLHTAATLLLVPTGQ
jgi:hypothetical protein